MSIRNLDINTYPQLFNVSLQNKNKFGEVNTDFTLIYKILDLIPKYKFKNPNLISGQFLKSMDYFSIVLYKLLYKHIPILDDDERHNHIITKMMYMIEINPEHIPVLKTLFGENANINCNNFIF